MHLRSQLRGRARGPIDLERRVTAIDPAGDPECGQITRVIGVQVADEDLVQLGIVRLKPRKPVRRSGPDIEEKRVTVSKLDQEACRDIARGLVRHPGPQGGDAHLVLAEFLGPREICARILVIDDLLRNASLRHVEPVDIVWLGLDRNRQHERAERQERGNRNQRSHDQLAPYPKVLRPSI